MSVDGGASGSTYPGEKLRSPKQLPLVYFGDRNGEQLLEALSPKP